MIKEKTFGRAGVRLTDQATGFYAESNVSCSRESNRKQAIKALKVLLTLTGGKNEKGIRNALKSEG